MCIALEGADNDSANPILFEAIALWKNSPKYRHLYSKLVLYLVGVSEGEAPKANIDVDDFQFLLLQCM